MVARTMLVAFVVTSVGCSSPPIHLVQAPSVVRVTSDRASAGPQTDEERAALQLFERTDVELKRAKARSARSAAPTPECGLEARAAELAARRAQSPLPPSEPSPPPQRPAASP